MTTLHLQRIEISNFRAYGETFSLSLPVPGVVILTGREGLGKRALFEAIEWALTGQVRRLDTRSQEGLAGQSATGLLARREQDVPVARYGVCLEFVDGEGERTRLERQAARQQDNPGQFAEVCSLAPHTLDAALSAARGKVAQGVKRKSLLTAQIDRHTHEMWMLQSYLHNTTKTIQRIKELDSRIHSLLLELQELERTEHGSAGGMPSQLAERRRLAQEELEAAQAARAPLQDLESLNDYQASLKARLEQLPEEIKQGHKTLPQLEEELRAAQTFQQHLELLAAEGTLPPEEPSAVDADAGAARLFSMSKAYRWSQWPALLLDEPLPPEDLIQDEALLEALCRLVRERRYQVIVSLHDEALADGLRRQLEVAGIQCVTCRYTGLGATGVTYSTG